MTQVVFTASGSWTAPAGVTTIDAQCWGEGGNGGVALNGSHSGAGGSGGEYAEETTLTVTPGSTYTFTIGTGGTATNTVFPGDSVTVTAHAGGSATGQSSSAGGTGSVNTIHHDGGRGANGTTGTNKGGGGGGSSAGTGTIGAGGTASSSTVGGAGGTAPSGGGNGGDGGGSTVTGNNGSAPGGGAGGGGDNGAHSGGTGAAGQITLTFTVTTTGAATLAGAGTLTAAGAVPGTASFPQIAPGQTWLRRFKPWGRHIPPPTAPPVTVHGAASLAGTGTLTAAGGLPSPAIVNQWATTFSQPAVFGTTPPALQSTVVPLTSAYSVGGGSGTPTAGNWLFCITGWNQAGLPAATVADADDIHSFWRPGDVTASTWAVSTSAGKTRTSVWYTPNLARVAGDVYAAPNGAMAGTACLVVEVAGLGAWDTVTGIATNYAAAATTLNLALPAPSAPAFILAAVCGDSSAAAQAFAPASWTTLASVTAGNGVDHTCDAVLTSACLPSTSGSVSVNGTAGLATDLSGVIIGVQTAAASPISAGMGVTPAWPGRMILEAGFGSGYETPPDQITWTVLSDSGVAAHSQTKRFWGWADSGGVPYTLGQLQSGTGTAVLDNFDSHLSPGNAASPWYPNVVTGTPVRLRVALGTITDRPGGTTVTVNRWYIISRNALEFSEKRDEALRNYVETALTDIWSVVAGTCPTPYRGEIGQDKPGWWWPMDDQPLSGGVQPASLRNAAAGSTTVMTVTASPGGITAGDAYTTTGLDATNAGFASPPFIPPSVATYSAGGQQGWMYGDPQSSPQSYATGNPVTSSPGSAAWQQTGLAGSGGANTWFLAATATYPALSTGVTVKGWFNAAFFGTAAGWHNTFTGGYYSIAGQPYSAITLATLSTATAPVAILQLDLSGHLILITYNGTTPTSHTVYSSSDLRSGSWHCVDLQLTQTTWAVYVNGGLTATAKGTVSAMTSAWTWLTLNGDYGTNGGSSPASIQHGGNVAYSHWAVFTGLLPAWRLTAHYAAAITGFGVLPAPQTVALASVSNEFGTGYVPDGSLYQGGYGGGGGKDPFTFSGVAAATAGTYTSGPSARAVAAGLGTTTGGTGYGNAVWISWTSLSPLVTVYTSASADAETSAAGVAGSGDSFSSAFGASAVDAGVCAVSNGTGASPPAGPSPLGDSVSQRIERVLNYGLVTYPGRAVDPTPNAVQAALDVGGQQCGASVQNVVSSDNGMLFVDGPGVLNYRSKAHMAADTVVWNLSSAGPASGYPFKADQTFDNDPQRVVNVISVSPYSPDGASLPTVTPTNATTVNTSQQQYGPRPYQVTSYLQSSAEQQAQADWLASQFSTLHRRVSTITVDASGYPPAWVLVLGVNPGDLVQISDQPMQGGPLSVGTYRVSSVSRRIFFGANQSKPEGSVTIVADMEPTSYWT